MYRKFYFIYFFGVSFFQLAYCNKNFFTVDEYPLERYNFDDDKPEDLSAKYEAIQIWYPKSGYKVTLDDFSYLNFFAFGENITVPLRPLESDIIGADTPIWLAEMIYKKMHYKKLPQSTVGQEFKMYATSKYTVIGTGFDDNGLAYFTGKIGNLTIVPLGSDESYKLRRRKRNIDDEILPGTVDPSGNFVLSGYHKIYMAPMENGASFNNILEGIYKIRDNDDWTRTKRDVTDVEDDTIHPEILLYTDYGPKFYEPRGLLFNSYIMYVISFWNSVNLYFSQLQNPRVSLRITGIVIGMNPFSVPFFLQHNVGIRGFFGYESILDMINFFNQNTVTFPRNSYDIAIAMTDRYIYSSASKSSVQFYKYSISGIATTKGSCNKAQYYMNMVGIIQDKFDYSGIRTAVHETGHILHATHDDTEIEKRDLSMCDPHDENYYYTMNQDEPDKYINFVWSNCSRNMISYFLRSNLSHCMHKDSTVDTGAPIPYILPGEITSSDNQCQIRGYSYSCEADGDTCRSLKCYTSGFYGLFSGWKCKDAGKALDGTICGKNKYCMAGKCMYYARDKIIKILQNKKNDTLTELNKTNDNNDTLKELNKTNDSNDKLEELNNTNNSNNKLEELNKTNGSNEKLEELNNTNNSNDELEELINTNGSNEKLEELNKTNGSNDKLGELNHTNNSNDKLDELDNTNYSNITLEELNNTNDSNHTLKKLE